MENVAKGLIVLSALAFLLAVVFGLTDQALFVTSEGYSRACNNLAILAIALMLMERKR